MGTSPEELKAQIDRTREDLVADVDALAEKVNPVTAAQNNAVKTGIVVVGAVVLTGTLVRRRTRKHRARLHAVK